LTDSSCRSLRELTQSGQWRRLAVGSLLPFQAAMHDGLPGDLRSAREARCRQSNQFDATVAPDLISTAAKSSPRG